MAEGNAVPAPIAGEVAGSAPSRRDWSTYWRLLGYVADQKAWFLVAVVGSLMATGGELGFAKVLGLIVDAVGAPLPWHIWALPTAMLILALARAFGTVAGEYALSRVSFRAIHVIRSRLFERLLVMPSAFYDKSAQGNLVSRLTFTTSQVRDTATDVMKIVVFDGAKAIVFLAALFYQNWLLTLTFLAIVPLVGTIMHYTSRRFRNLSERIQSSMGNVTHVVSEAVSGYREVKIFAGEEYERERFVAASDRNRRQNLKMMATKALSAQTIQLLAAAALATLVCLILLPQFGGDMSAGDLATYLTLAGALANPIKKLSDVNARLQRGLAAATDIFAQLDQPSEDDAGTLEVERVAGEIRFDHVSFAYDADAAPVLRDIDLVIKPGQTVALVGPSGAGKSTFASLIARFYQPTSGRILLDGEPLGSYRLSCLRRQIALVTQDVTLFNDTLANNIAYGSLADTSSEALDVALRRAHADGFVANMPQGLSSVVGDDGVLLSGGQRQRVAIARALLKDAPVLILDEATSSLDAVSEQRVQAALEEVMRDRTTIVIAHRLSTVEKADVIVVVDDGRIVEMGDHRTLVAAHGAYAELYRSQFQSAATAAAAPARQPAPLRPVASTFEPLVKGWYEGRLWPWLLWPVSALFAWLATRRRSRYLAGRIRSWRAPVPVVMVGNVTAGGTGKTPLVIWLVRWLKARGMRTGVVSRGYGGKAAYPLLVYADTPAAQCGDEAAMIARRAECPVAVDPNRGRAVRALLAEAELDIIVADDGLQHYALERDMEIAVVDGLRGLGNGLCLPAGPLREPASRLRECHWVVANGVAAGLAEAESVMVAHATAVVNLHTGERLSPDEFASCSGAVVAVAGVGNPERFRATLLALGIAGPMRAFPDHHRFQPSDVAVEDGTAVIVTEKDAEKIKVLPDISHCWYLEIEMHFAESVDDRLERIFADRGIALGPRDEQAA